MTVTPDTSLEELRLRSIESRIERLEGTSMRLVVHGSGTGIDPETLRHEMARPGRLEPVVGGSLHPRISSLLEARVPRLHLTRVRIDDLSIIARALGQFRLLSTDEDDLAILELEEAQRTLLTEVRVEWHDV